MDHHSNSSDSGIGGGGGGNNSDNMLDSSQSISSTSTSSSQVPHHHPHHQQHQQQSSQLNNNSSTSSSSSNLLSSSNNNNNTTPQQQQLLQQPQGIIGNYIIVKTIGRGQFGKVKLGYHRKIPNEKVAIKIINKSKLDQDTLRMVQREVRIMKLLNHPNIIKLYEVIETNRALYLIMEYAGEGEVMDFMIAHGVLSENQARTFFIQIVSAMAYCHSKRAVHRDLKPENLLLDNNRQIKIIDFGLSNVFTPGSYLKTFCGSPTYASPELILRKEYNGPSVDIWSMGVVLFVLVTGYLPFDGDNYVELFQKILAAEYTIPDYLSPDCRSLISRMLVVDPTKRATMDEIILHPWMQPVFHLLNLSGGSTSTAASGGHPTLTSSSSSPNLLSTTTLSAQQQSDIFNSNIDNIDQGVLQELISLGYEKEEILNNVKQNKYNDCAATYFLLCSRKNREAHASTSRDVESFDAFYSDQPSINAPTGDKSPLIKYKRHHRRSQTADNSRVNQQQQQQQQQQKSQHLSVSKPPTNNVQNTPNESPCQSPGSTSPTMGTSPTNQPVQVTPSPNISTNSTNSTTITSGDKPPRPDSATSTTTTSSTQMKPEIKNQITNILTSAPVTPLSRGISQRQISRSANASASTSPSSTPTPGSPVGSFIKPSITISTTTTKQPIQRRATTSSSATSGGLNSQADNLHHIHNRMRSNSSSVADSQPKESKLIEDDWVIFEDYPDQLYTDGTYGGTPRHQYVKQYQASNPTSSSNSKKHRSSVHSLLSSFKNMLKRSEDKESGTGHHHHQHQQHAYTTHNTPILSSSVEINNNNNSNTNQQHQQHSAIDSLPSPLITSNNTPITTSEILQKDNTTTKDTTTTTTTTTEIGKEEHNELDHDQHHSEEPSTQPRIVRFVFGVHTTSMKPAPELMKQVLSVVSNFCIPHTQKGDYLLECESEGVRLTIEVCRLPRLSVNGLKFKRIGGSAWRYKGICKDLLSQMKLADK